MGTNNTARKPRKPDVEIVKVLLKLASGVSYHSIHTDVPSWSGADIYLAKKWFLSIDDENARTYVSGQDGADNTLRWRDAQLKIRADEERIRKLTRAHLEEELFECRWCFAVDLERVVGKEIARYDFPDATVWRFLCPRCGGEFSFYSVGYSWHYLRDMIDKLHPELQGSISDELFNSVRQRVLYDFNLEEYSDLRGRWFRILHR